MSNLFSNSSHYAAPGGAYTVPTTGSLFLWLYSTAAYNDGASHWYAGCGRNAPTILRCEIYKHTDSKWYCGWYNNGNEHRVIVSASGLTQNAWVPLLLTWANGGTTELFVSGSSIGTTASLDATFDTSSLRFTVGMNSGYDNKAANARIAWVTLWNVALTANEAAALARGIHPLRIRNDKIQDCWKLFGHDTPDYSWAGLRTALNLTYPQFMTDPLLQMDRLGRPQFADIIGAAVPNLSYAIGDILRPISDHIVGQLLRHRTANISDTLRPPSDRLYPLPIEAIHFTGNLSDSLQGVLDQIDAAIHVNRPGAVSDRLQVIRDSITAGMINLETPVRWVAPVSITSRAGVDPIYVAAHAVRHPERYFEPRVKSYGIFTRAISAPAGFVKTGDCNLTLLDPDNSLRQRMPAKTIRKATAEIRLGPEGGKLSAFLRPFNRQVGTVTQPADGELSMQLQDQCFDFLEREVPSVITEDNFPNLPESSGPGFGNLVFGIVSGEGGALACPLVDTVSFQYFACRNIAKSVDAVYRKGADDEDFVLVDPSEYTIVTNYWIEHEAGSGDYCTLIQFAVDQAGAEIRADIQGIQDDAGNLTCTNFADALLNAFEYLAWITNRMDALNLASFDETRTAVADLACAGALTEPITFGEFVSRMQRSSNIDVFADKNDRVAIHYTTDDEAPTVNLDDLLRLYKGTVKQQLADPTYNRLPYRYAPNYASGKWTEDKWDNPADQTALGEVTEEEPLQMYYVRDAATALAVVERRGQYLDLDSFRFEGEIPLVPVLEDLELADLVSIEHFGGIKVGGYTAEQFKILELSMDVDQLKYNFKGIRRRLPPPSLIESAMISGDAKTNSRVGPFSSGVDGELFAVFIHPTSSNILRVWRTTDYGLTWAIADEANQPVVANIIESFDGFVSEGMIYCATQEASTGRVAYHTFSMASSAWVTVNEQVLASASNGGAHCVSIECRYPAGEPVIYFQGDRELVGGSYWLRGYYSIKQAGTWSVPVLATPEPHDYPSDGYGPGVSSDCIIERVVAGRENRMHFFWAINPSVIWVRWSPDHYGRTLQGNFEWSGVKQHLLTGVHYPAPRNMGDGCMSLDRTKFITIRKNYWGQGFLEIYAEGPDLVMAPSPMMGNIIYNSWLTGNPAGFVRALEGDDGFYVGQNTWDRRTSLTHTDEDGIWTGAGSNYGTDPEEQLAAGPQYAYPVALYTLNGTLLKVRGRLYMAYFSDPAYPAYRWIRVDTLPYNP